MNYVIKEIGANEAKEIVTKYHYSKRVVPNSRLHLGVFKDSFLVGCLSFGPPMNGDKTAKKISTTHTKMFELNRMVMDDDQPRNSESQAISACLKYLKKHTDIDYILSFSDGKEGNVGYIYQATNWKYLGFMLSDSFYKIDGEYVHAVTVWHRYKEKHPLRDTHTTNQIVCLSHKDVKRVVCKQHVYVMPLHRNVVFGDHVERCYPKKDREKQVLREIGLTLSEIGDVVETKTDYDTFPIVDLFGRRIK